MEVGYSVVIALGSFLVGALGALYFASGRFQTKEACSQTRQSCCEARVSERKHHDEQLAKIATNQATMFRMLRSAIVYLPIDKEDMKNILNDRAA